VQVEVRFAKPDLLASLLHGVATPSVAYLLLVVGLLLIVFEFFTAGVGVAAVVAVGVLTLAAYGLGELPTRLSGVLLIAVGVLGYSIDVQAGAPRTWTAVGTIALAVGSVRLYDGQSVPLWVMAVVLAGTALAMVSGMPAMVRARFSTPTIGRESMIGDSGVALDDVAPEGRVEVRGAPWRARTNRATPIVAGAVIRVVGIDGLVLEVEPESGGARDYRH
jgi:membrane-bound serine protease (ClpP class)